LEREVEENIKKTVEVITTSARRVRSQGTYKLSETKYTYFAFMFPKKKKQIVETVATTGCLQVLVLC
jgi:hypothetical protein